MARRIVDDDRDIVVVREEGSDFLSFLVGAAVGAGLALFFTPYTGEEMQRRLRRRVHDIRELAEDKADEWGDLVEDRLDDRDAPRPGWGRRLRRG